MKKKGLQVVFKDKGGGTLEINGLAPDEIAYAIGMIAKALEDKTDRPQSEWLKMISDTNDAMDK